MFITAAISWIRLVNPLVYAKPYPEIGFKLHYAGVAYELIGATLKLSKFHLNVKINLSHVQKPEPWKIVT